MVIYWVFTCELVRRSSALGRAWTSRMRWCELREPQCKTGLLNRSQATLVTDATGAIIGAGRDRLLWLDEYRFSVASKSVPLQDDAVASPVIRMRQTRFLNPWSVRKPRAFGGGGEVSIGRSVHGFQRSSALDRMLAIVLRRLDS